MEQTGNFGVSTYSIRDLQLFHDADHDRLAPLLAECAIVRLGAGERLEDSSRARLYIVLSGMLSVAADAESGMLDAAVSRILPGESVGEQSVLDDSANLRPEFAAAVNNRHNRILKSSQHLLGDEGRG